MKLPVSSMACTGALGLVLFACSSSPASDDDSTGGSGTRGGTSGVGGAVVKGGTANGGAGASNAGAPAAGHAGSGGIAQTGGSGSGGQAGMVSSGGAGGAGNSGTGGAAVGGAGLGGQSGSGGSAAGSGGIGGEGAGSGGASGGVGGAAGGAGGAGPQHWVATWAASPYLDSGNPPPVSLANSVLRQVTHVSLGGSQLRFQFSNLSGNGNLTINAAHIALCKATPLVDSTIDTATDKSLAFSGMPSVTIAQGKEVWSDPIDFTAAPLANITITIALGSVPSNLTAHSGSRTTSYIQSGSDVSAANMTSAQTTDHWWFISGIDVMAPESAVTVAAIGDSITDGRGTDTNGNNRWTDILAARLQANPATAHVAVVNQGIGATNLVGSSGTAAQARFNRDVLGQSAIRYAIVLDGVNDISGNASFNTLKAAYDDLISKAHAKSVLIYGGTITPFGANSYYSVSHEDVRQQVNTYIKSGAFDGYIDFDAAVTDGGNPPKLKSTFAAWSQEDGLHPGPAGYKAMGDAADLMLFTK